MHHLTFLLTFREEKEMLVKQLQRTGTGEWWFSVVYFQHNKVKIHWSGCH